MKNRKNRLLTYTLFSIALGVLFVSSCKKDKEEITLINPYEDAAVAPTVVSTLSDIDPSNFAHLQTTIFSPFCANSGCHDGTFPPDYRTINSSYNTLVYQKPVNDAGGQFVYRVMPGNASQSILFHRMTVPIGSGIMPVDYSVDATWTDNEATHIANIKSWINAGAKDMFGNAPSLSNLQPVISGLVAFPAGTTTGAYSRGSGSIAALNVPANSSIDVWFLIEDDATVAAGFTNDTCKLSTSISNFATATTSMISYTSSGLSDTDFNGDNATFYHKATISTVGYLPGEDLYLRTVINDGSQATPTEIPNQGSSNILKGYFALKIQ